MNFTDQLKVAQNIIAQKGMSGIDLFSEMAKSMSLLNGIASQGGMTEQMPQEVPPEPLTQPINPQETQQSPMGESGLEMPV